MLQKQKRFWSERKNRIVLGLLAAVILVTVAFSMHVSLEAEQDLWQIYVLAMEAGMAIDTALNYDMKYIAIDFETLEGVTPKDEFLIMSHFERKYQVEVFKANYHQLQAQGYFNEAGVLDGVLLSVQKKRNFFHTIHIEGTKFKSGTGAIGYKATVLYAGINKWRLLKSKMIWIS